ncbi:pyruvate formate lyase family protein [uncultured Faecalibaculum sp.]|uniref:pyruvate formate lyase family protein n=1 Tax=uncultured Faecalibaculum sp. TaxID=1729681 RepID=UPI0025F11DCA|nr:pyruvate formate lyase family protein [uncultured Faecalibaculum sp.]
MKHINIDGAQNVEVSRKLPSEKTPEEQLALMERYTRVYRENLSEDKAIREVRCLSVIYPDLFRHLEPGDLTAGRLDFLPIGFGCVTSVGGVGHYCVFHKLRGLKNELPEDQWHRVDALYDFWQEHDLKTLYCQDVLDETVTGRFIDCAYPYMATARLSGMMLDYGKLMRLGVPGMKEEIRSRLVLDPDNAYLQASLEMMDLFEQVIHAQQQLVTESREVPESAKARMIQDLAAIEQAAPATFRQALQLFWLYALCAGCINYGRLDIILGPYLKADIDAGIETEESAQEVLESLWMLIENRRTTVNGRIIVGGRGRPDPEAADLFAKICLRVVKKLRCVEPQFTFRFDSRTDPVLKDMAYECIAAGATYPTLYNDDVNIPAVQYAMRVDRKTAEQYLPFGCGEFVIQGQSVGTPNTLLNMVKVLQIAMNEGIDPMDGQKKNGPVELLPLSELTTFEAFYAQYRRLLDWYFEKCARDQLHSYEVMNREVSFLFASALMDDCLARGKALLDGGVRILGGTLETYGNINASDALTAVKRLVFEERKYTLEEMNEAASRDFQGDGELLRDILAVPKYGNDEPEADDMADDLYEFTAKSVRQKGIDLGMDYFLIVISNNQTNTDWGLQTAASLDGRRKGVYMNPANNPQGGAAKSGPTAVLNSLSRFDARYHGGSVQNIKFTPRMMHEDKEKVKILFDTYFRKGGCQLMVTVVDKGQLEDAQKHPEKYPDLIVRVAGYSAVFVDLDKTVQDELLSRALWD